MYLLTRILSRNSILTKQQRTFEWLNIVFNSLDEERRDKLGPDRTCAEWLLRNGASVKWTNASEFLTDYNLLPDEKDGAKLCIKEIDASNSSISHHGFKHFVGCNHIVKIIFHNCLYLEDKALKDLYPLKKTLKYLKITNCMNITDQGLLNLKNLDLSNLDLSGLPYVKDKTNIVISLKNVLPSCDVKFK